MIYYHKPIKLNNMKIKSLLCMTVLAIQRIRYMLGRKTGFEFTVPVTFKSIIKIQQSFNL